MPKSNLKFLRQQREYTRQCKRLKSAERRFRKDVQNQLQTRAEARQVKLSMGKTCTTEELVTGIKSLHMTDDLRGQLSYLRRLRGTLKLPIPTPELIIKGA